MSEKKKNKAKKSPQKAGDHEMPADDETQPSAEFDVVPAGSSVHAEAHEKHGGSHGGSHGESHGGHTHHAPNRKEYWKVFFALFALTVLEVAIATLDKHISKSSLVAALVGLALTKAAIVAFFYMHLKHESKWMRMTVAIPMGFPALYAFILIAEGMYRALWGAG